MRANRTPGFPGRSRMYLARKETGPRRQSYILRETYHHGGILCSRDLADLGGNPGAIFVYDDDASFHIDEAFLHRLREQGVAASDNELEDLFFPFLDPYIRQRVQPFRDRAQYRNWRPTDAVLLQRALEETQPMDRRRLHFLRLGRSSVEAFEKTAAFYTVLLDKSRDEIEQMIREQELILKPREYQSYLFGIFDLQRFFKESYARTMPQALDREQLDTLLLQEVCRCAADAVFWQGYPLHQGLQPPLIRYLVMYFDGVPEQTPAWARFADSARSRRFHSAGGGRSSGTMSRSQAMALFGLSGEQLAAMCKRDLTRLYRQKAFELHPDTGGDTDRFVHLTRAYEELLPSLQ